MLGAAFCTNVGLPMFTTARLLRPGLASAACRRPSGGWALTMSTATPTGDAPAVAPSCVPCEGIGCAYSSYLVLLLVWILWAQFATKWRGTGSELSDDIDAGLARIFSSSLFFSQRLCEWAVGVHFFQLPWTRQRSSSLPLFACLPGKSPRTAAPSLAHTRLLLLSTD